MHSEWPKVRPVSYILSPVIIHWLRQLFETWGLPHEVITDNERQFVSHEFDKIICVKGIKHIQTANYHLQSNSPKRFNRVLSKFLRIAKVKHREIYEAFTKSVQRTCRLSTEQLACHRRNSCSVDALRCFWTSFAKFSLDAESTSTGASTRRQRLRI